MVMGISLDEEGAPRALKHIEESIESFMSAGDRGELVAALILILARNNWEMCALVENAHKGTALFKHDGSSKGRIATVLEFVEALVPSESYRDVGGRGPPSVPQVIHSRRTLQALSVIRTYILITLSRCTTARR